MPATGTGVLTTGALDAEASEQVGRCTHQWRFFRILAREENSCRSFNPSGSELYEEIRVAKGKRTAEGGALSRPPKQKKEEPLRVRDPWG